MTKPDEILKNAVEHVLADDGFKILTPSSRSAVEDARKLLQWFSLPNSKEVFYEFAEKLVSDVDRCFDPPKKYVTECVLKVKIKTLFPITAHPVNVRLGTLSYEEKNALRYAAGYIPRAIRKKIAKSSNPAKQCIMLWLDDMLQSETEDHESDNWIKLVDRGGLNHVSNAMYMAIVSMELEVQKQLQQDSTLTSKFKTKLTKCLLDSEDVMFFWSIVAAPWESGDEMEMKLLGMVIDMWLTIRGFSYASDWMEKLKVQEKKTKQKSKGIRKTLYKD
ncbi:hypothetical protein EMCRGX_G020308 [Ephydatia muelleri]